LFVGWALTATELVGSGFIFWMIRDGILPEAGPSGGFGAVSRFARSASLPFVIILMVPVVCSLSGYAKRKRPNQASQPSAGDARIADEASTPRG
jgi:hypothetical protein